jgi:ADP-heptose:LPS heptosyltransferase
MPGVLQELAHGAAVAVIRLRSLGDCVLTTPALHILKRARPDLRIGVVVEERFASIFSGNPDVHAILPPCVADIRRWRPSLALNMHGGSRSISLTALSGARVRAGFAHFRASGVYSVRIPTAQEILSVTRKVHTAEHLASAIFYLGAARCPIPRAKLFADDHQASRPYAAIHAVAATPEKTWPPERFLEVARQLERSHGLEPVFLAGPGEDLSLFSEFRTLAGAPLDHVKSVIKGASLFIGNDSGPAHIAAAFGVPVVVLFGPSDPVVWAPWQVEAEVLTGRPSIDAIAVDEVIRAVDRLMVAR